MKEDEAKKKCCPIKWRDILTDGKQILKGGDATCSASACMMWREDLTWDEAQSGYRAANGHCGLGGS